jgi:hypothetical protein
MNSAQRAAIASPAAGLMVYETTSSSTWIYNGSTWVQLASGGASPWTVSGNNIYNSNSANVGIGISTPLEKLHLVGDFKQDNGIITLNNAGSIIQFQNAGVNKSYVQLSGDNLRMGTNSGNQFGKAIFRMAGQDRVFIDSTGNIQILGLQDVSLTTHGYLTLGSLTGDNLILDAQEIQARTNGNADDMVMQNEGGNIGIGIFPPQARLHVRGSTGIDEIAINSGVIGESATIQFYNTLSSGIIRKGVVYLDGEDLKIGTNSGNVNGRFIIRTDGADRMFVDEAGNVSIATTTTAAGYKLHVGGKAICEELKVQLVTNWPDYVFNNTYKLRTIDELNNFIKQNKHLPGIPSANEIESNGMEVGDMQKRMIEKIEELTLYIILLKKEIDELKSSK